MCCSWWDRFGKSRTCPSPAALRCGADGAGAEPHTDSGGHGQGSAFGSFPPPLRAVLRELMPSPVVRVGKRVSKAPAMKHGSSYCWGCCCRKGRFKLGKGSSEEMLTVHEGVKCAFKGKKSCFLALPERGGLTSHRSLSKAAVGFAWCSNNCSSAFAEAVVLFTPLYVHDCEASPERC